MVKGNSKITRVPRLKDTFTMIQLMEIIGAKCDFTGNTLLVNGDNINNPEAPYELVKTMRASFYVLGTSNKPFWLCESILARRVCMGSSSCRFSFKST